MTEFNANDGFTRMMQKSRLIMPFSDFEDKVMYQILKESHARSSISKNAKLSVLFFVLGSFFGLFAGDFLSGSLETIFNLPKEDALLFFQFGYLFLFLIQLDNMIKLFKGKAYNSVNKTG